MIIASEACTDFTRVCNIYWRSGIRVPAHPPPPDEPAVHGWALLCRQEDVRHLHALPGPGQQNCFLIGKSVFYHSFAFVAQLFFLGRSLNKKTNCRNNWARCQLSYSSLYSATIFYSATHLFSKQPISLLSYSSFYIATYLSTKPAIYFFYLATHLSNQPPMSHLSNPSPYLANHFSTQPPIFLLSHPSLSLINNPSLYLATYLSI